MNKELEETIKLYNELKRNKEIIANIDKDFFFKFADGAIAYIENSISKEVIEKKIEENAFEVHTREWGNVEVISIEVLQEILEEEK